MRFWPGHQKQRKRGRENKDPDIDRSAADPRIVFALLQGTKHSVQKGRKERQPHCHRFTSVGAVEGEDPIAYGVPLKAAVHAPRPTRA